MKFKKKFLPFVLGLTLILTAVPTNSVLADIPIAVDDDYDTDANTTLNTVSPGVLSNDSDADSDPLEAVLVDDIDPAAGTLSLSVDGSFIFIPALNYKGTATFTYTADGGGESSNTATVTINVNNTAPEGTGDSYEMLENDILTIVAPGVLGNDSDGEDDSLEADLVTDVSHGALTLNSDGSFTYEPNADYEGTDSFTYRIWDGEDYSDAVTVEINVNGMALLGAAVSIVSDGTSPWEDELNPDVNDPGDDLSDNNGIVRTLDRATYSFSYSIVDNPAENLVMTLTLDDYAYWDWLDVEDLLDMICEVDWSLSSDSRIITCEMGAVTEQTVDFSLPAIVDYTSPHGSLFNATIDVRSDNGIPNPDANECGDPTAEGCQAVSDDLEVSATIKMETMKINGSASCSNNSCNQNADTYYGNAVTTDLENEIFIVSWKIAYRAGDEDDPRGSAPIDPSTIGALSDVWKAWEYADGGSNRRSPDPANIFDLPMELLDCQNTNFGNVSHAVAGTAYPDRYVTDATWTCTQPGGAGEPILIEVQDMDVNRTPPIYGWNRAGYANVEGLVATAQVRIQIPFSAVEDHGGDVIVRNCFAVDSMVNDEPGDSQFWPTGFSGELNNFGQAESLDNNCGYARLEIPAGIGGRGYCGKNYIPSVTRELQRVLDGSEYEADVDLRNSAGEDPSLVDELTDIILCDKFDNRVQVLNGEAYLDSTTFDPIPDGIIEYGVGPWGVASGLIYDKDAAWDHSWYIQSTATCDDGDADWYSYDQISWDNTAGAGEVNVADINAVRVIPDVEIDQGENLHLLIPLEALDNEVNSWLMNYGITKFSNSPENPSVWNAFGVAFECYGIDHENELCPQDISYFQPGHDYRPGQCADLLLHSDVKVDVTKSVVGDTTKFAGETIEWELMVTTAYEDYINLIVPPSEGVLKDVELVDILPEGFEYINGTVTQDGLPLGEPYVEEITSTPYVLGKVNINNAAQKLIFNLGDLPMGDDEAAVVRFSSKTNPLIKEGESRTNWVTVTASNDIELPDCRDYNWNKDKCYSASVNFVALTSAAVWKDTRNDHFKPGETLQMGLMYAPLRATNIEWVDFVDILPYNGDSRGTDFSGNIVLENITAGYLPDYPAPTHDYEIWASAIPPQELDGRGSSLAGDDFLAPATIYGGNGRELGIDSNGDSIIDWPCRIEVVQAGLCSEIPGMADITAIRFYGPDPEEGVSGEGSSVLTEDDEGFGITLNFSTAGVPITDYFANSFGGNFQGMPLGVEWPDDAQPEELALGDLIFEDVNGDGAYQEGMDIPVEGVEVVLLDGSGNYVMDPLDPTQIYKTTTRSDGRYLFDLLFSGNYIVELSASNFNENGPLYGMIPNSIVESGSANDDEDEDIDHNATFTQANGSVRSGVVTLDYGDEPRGETLADGLVPTGMPDNTVNLTVDFGFVQYNGENLSGLPGTGFPKDVITKLQWQPKTLAYHDQGGLYLQIPKLEINTQIVGVPFKREKWDVQWLGNNAGWLEGTAYPGTEGNSVISGHLYDAEGLPGIFINLEQLEFGDLIKLCFGENEMSYRVVETYYTFWDDTQSVLQSEDESRLTLFTCRDYNKLTGKYDARFVVKAAEVK